MIKTLLVYLMVGLVVAEHGGGSSIEEPMPTEEPSEEPTMEPPSEYMGPLECNMPVSGNLHAGDYHFYSFEVETTPPGQTFGTVYGNTCDSELDVVLSIYDVNGALAAGPFDGQTMYDYDCSCRAMGNMDAECVAPNLPVGTYFLYISTPMTAAKAGHGMSYTFIPECPEEPTSSPEPTMEPRPTTPPFMPQGEAPDCTDIAGNLGPGEFHGYYFETDDEEPGFGGTCGSELDTVVYIVDADSMEVVAFFDDDKSEHCDDDCGQVNECIMLALPPGRYWAVIGGFDSTQSGRYMIGSYCEEEPEPNTCMDNHEAVMGLTYELGVEPMSCHDIKGFCHHDDFGHYLRSMCGDSCGGCDVWGHFCGHDDTFGLTDFFGGLGIESRDDCAHLAECGYCAHEGWSSLMWHYCPCSCKEFFEEMYDDGSDDSDSDSDSDSDDYDLGDVAGSLGY